MQDAGRSNPKQSKFDFIGQGGAIHGNVRDINSAVITCMNVQLTSLVSLTETHCTYCMNVSYDSAVTKGVKCP
jgi:hypothetical protein